MDTAGTGFVAARDRRNIRPMADIAEDGAAWDRLGYHALALWQAFFIQAYEATHPESCGWELRGNLDL